MISIVLQDDKFFDKFAKNLSKISKMHPIVINRFLENEVQNYEESIRKQQKPEWENKITHSKYVDTPKNPWMPFSKARYYTYSQRGKIKSWWIVNNRMFYERFVNDGHAIRRKKRGPAIGYAPPSHHINNGISTYTPISERKFDELIERYLC